MVFAPFLIMLILGMVNVTVGLAKIPSSGSLVVPIKDSTPVKKSDLGDELLVWDPPEYIQKHAPYYLAGYDDEGRPVWIAEAGKYPMKDLGEMASTEDGWAALNKYIQQASLHVIRRQNTTEREVTEAVAILDLEGFDMSVVLFPKAVLMGIRVFTAYADLIIHYIGGVTIINGNYAVEMTVNSLRPILGRAMEKIEIYGTNSNKWKNALRRKIPEKVLPPWYGGAPTPDFKPIQIYG